MKLSVSSWVILLVVGGTTTAATSSSRKKHSEILQAPQQQQQRRSSGSNKRRSKPPNRRLRRGKLFRNGLESQVQADEWEDGNTYPVIKVEVSSASHPFYTGKNIFLDTAGRVEKFNRRYKKK